MKNSTNHRPTTKSELIALLDRSEIAYDCLESGSCWVIVAPSLAARIMGAGVGEENALWVPPALPARGWEEGGGSGGQRSWIAPEAGPAGFFFSSDGSGWEVPIPLDPGSYTPFPAAGGWHGYRTAFTALSADGSRYPITLARSMRMQEEAGAGDHANALRIMFRHELANAGPTIIDRRIGLWGIIQLPCEEPGTIIFGVRTERRDGSLPLRPYFNELPAGIAGASGRLAWIRAAGGKKFKVGLAAPESTGSIAFVRPSRVSRGVEDRFLLTAVKFPVDPAGTYLDKPYHKGPEAARNGDAAQAYNAPGTGDRAYCEIESHAPAPRLGPGESHAAEMEIFVACLDSEQLATFMPGRLGMDFVPRSAL